MREKNSRVECDFVRIILQHENSFTAVRKRDLDDIGQFKCCGGSPSRGYKLSVPSSLTRKVGQKSLTWGELAVFGAVNFKTRPPAQTP
jgi:hypothetical protein